MIYDVLSVKKCYDKAVQGCPEKLDSAPAIICLAKQSYQIHNVANSARGSGNRTRHNPLLNGHSPADLRTGTAAGYANREANPHLIAITEIRSSLFMPSPAFMLDKNGFTIIKHSSAPIPTLQSGQLERDRAPREYQLPRNSTSHGRPDWCKGSADSGWEHGTVRTRLFRELERRPTPPPAPEGTVLPNTNIGNYPALKADCPRVKNL